MSDPLPIAIASDHAGLALKEHIKQQADLWGVTFEDLGTHSSESTDYPDYAHALAEAILSGRAQRGILVCGTGLGMSMAANRHAGIRAAVCSESYSARLTRQHNDANVLCLGARVIGPGVAEDVVGAFLTTAFEGGRHSRRVDKI